MSKRKMSRILEEKAEKAKEVIEKTGDEMVEVLEKSGQDMSAALNDVSSKLKENYNLAEKQVSSAFSSSVSKAGKQVSRSTREVKDYGAEKVQKSVQQFQESLPTLEKAGFELRGVDIDISVIPKVVARFAIVKHINSEEQENLLREIRDDRAMTTLLKSLFKAESIQKALNFTNLEFQGVDIHIGSLPRVAIRFRK